MARYPKKLIIGIDVDGVLRDFCHGLTKVIKEHYPEYIKETDIPEQYLKITDWHLEKNFNCSLTDLQQIYWHDHAKEILGNGLPIRGSLVQMHDLFEWAKGYKFKLWCITSQKEHARHLTLKWLGDNQLDFEQVIFCKGMDKWKTGIDWLIDDSPANWSAWKKGRGIEKFILMDKPYNEHIDPAHRITDLTEIKNIIISDIWDVWR